MSAAFSKKKVFVTGAGGRTGKLVFEKLQSNPDYHPVGLVRSDKAAAQLKEMGAGADQVVVGDILQSGGEAMLAEALAGAEALMVCTSAVPEIKKLSLIPVLLAKLFRREGVRPKFSFKAGQLPEQVDWQAQRVQFDAAKAAGVSKVVVCGSMGGTQRDNFLNTIGDGNILVWKRRAEAYLCRSGLNYVIVHPGGLKDNEGGQRELVLGVDDALLAGSVRSIPRADVAELMVQCLSLADRRSIDVVARDPGAGTPTVGAQGYAALLAGMADNCAYADMDDDVELLAVV